MGFPNAPEWASESALLREWRLSVIARSPCTSDGYGAFYRVMYQDEPKKPDAIVASSRVLRNHSACSGHWRSPAQLQEAFSEPSGINGCQYVTNGQ